MSEAILRALPIWRGEVEITPLSGGLTNLNYRVIDGDRTYAARTGTDVLLSHQVPMQEWTSD